jgi:hypothetical protein
MTIESQIIPRHRLCVVLDTNTWRSQYVLKTQEGMLFGYTLGRQHALLGLPGVIERELTKHIIKVGLEETEKAAKSSRILSTLTGLPSLSSSVSAGELEKLVVSRLEELEPILERVPFTLAHAAAALDMVNAETPPNGKKDQQFKDSAIWQAVLDLSREYIVHLVTGDRGFYRDRDTKNGSLAVNLQEDCKAVNGSVILHKDLDSCMRAITRERPKFDRNRVISLIKPYVTQELRAQAERNRLQHELREIVDDEITAFSTDKPDCIALDFAVTIRCELEEPIFAGQPKERRAFAFGSCDYHPESNSITGEFIQEIRFVSPGYMSAREFRHVDPAIPFSRPLPPRQY